jgi:outer membrane protein OmpA-like peptidoglycan-associated protein
MMHRPVLVVALLLAAGCPGNDLRGRTHGISDLIREARDHGAYKCAPRELAMAESHLSFADAELDHGSYFPARREIGISEENARKAIELSPKDKCNPAPDKDGDGVLDPVDKCPTIPGPKENAGCPWPDQDKDGVFDKDDKCPTVPGPKENAGCPWPDSDGDGVFDKDDKCPNTPGPKENDGCPWPDRDGDTVFDKDDKCPDVPGPPDNDGCPKPKFIVVTKEKIELKQKVHFATDKSRIYPDSFPMLSEVAEVLKSRPEIKVRIEGHTDSRGSMSHNMKLSQARAESVRQFLVGQGVDIARMEAQGFGPNQPLEDNRTSKGREANRRTEFIITAQ